jgi:hypothetical protein
MAKAKPGVSTQNLSSKKLKQGGADELPHRPPRAENKAKMKPPASAKGKIK